MKSGEKMIAGSVTKIYNKMKIALLRVFGLFYQPLQRTQSLYLSSHISTNELRNSEGDFMSKNLSCSGAEARIVPHRQLNLLSEGKDQLQYSRSQQGIISASSRAY